MELPKDLGKWVPPIKLTVQTSNVLTHAEDAIGSKPVNFGAKPKVTEPVVMTPELTALDPDKVAEKLKKERSKKKK